MNIFIPQADIIESWKSNSCEASGGSLTLEAFLDHPPKGVTSSLLKYL